jgi:hypothetical protein
MKGNAAPYILKGLILSVPGFGALRIYAFRCA